MKLEMHLQTQELQGDLQFVLLQANLVILLSFGGFDAI
jgi:hypothetical protein